MTDELLAVRDLRVGFGTESGLAQVLDNVNLNMWAGEIVGLVGESGCGKTTLARAILGVLPRNSARIDSGTIHFQDRDLLRLDPNEMTATVRGRDITFIPQDPYSSFNPVFTVGTQIMELMKWKSPDLRPEAEGEAVGRLGRYPRQRYRADRARVLDLLNVVQLPQPEQILGKYPHELSGGQRQRLMIAMALLPEPRLIIADEPTTALDVTIQAQILKLVRRLATERGVAVLFTTHDLGTAYEICDSVTVMYAGQEMEAAPSEAFFTRPSHPYTKRLLESLPSHEHGIRGIEGEIPTLINPPTGCRFHPRCEFADAACREARPGPDLVAERHSVRCFHPVTELTRRAAQ